MQHFLQLGKLSRAVCCEGLIKVIVLAPLSAYFAVIVFFQVSVCSFLLTCKLESTALRVGVKALIQYKNDNFAAAQSLTIVTTKKSCVGIISLLSGFLNLNRAHEPVNITSQLVFYPTLKQQH